MQYELDGKLYNVEIVRKHNKNSYIKLKDDLTIYVTTNYLATNTYIKDLLDSNQSFLRRAIDSTTKRIEKHKQFYLFGKGYNIKIDPTITKIYLQDNNIIVKNEKEFNKWIAKEIKRIYQEHLDYWYDRFEEKIPYPILKIRNMKTRWGVCNKKDNSVTLNSRLIEYELDKLDYVIIHELSHFVHFNHSASFWKEVSKYCPKYKQMRKDLKE